MSEAMAVAAAVPVPSSPVNAEAAPHLPQASSKPTQAPPSEMFDVKVNGKIVKMTRQEVIDHASMSHAANDKFNEAKKTRAEVDRIIKTAKDNPIQALMDPSLGLSKEQIRDAFEKWYTTEFIEPETLTADQRKMKEYEAKVAKYEKEEAEKKAQAEREEEEKLTTNQREYLQNQIIEAMDRSGLPKTKDNVKKMAFYMRQNLLNGWEAPMELVISQVKKDRKQEISDISEQSSIEQLIEMFGEGIINKIRQHDLKQLRERRNFAPATSGVIKSTGQHEKVYSSDVAKRLKEMRTKGW